ncbi:DUF6868 family protein [Shimia abyssi]|uniref:DUF6868 domain-containing protein n=1 Tax=Shimia abyssi TaxID=1662395 RepID=A0A2P8FBI6_9RHOB|nr:hypothetical protein [Shimia abyssi]PSL19091.1 hypothetical protein CLV88_10734 [Shimia abyssi]
MTLEALSSFFGWMSVIHYAILVFASIMMLAARDWATSLHARMFDIGQNDVRRTYYNWLGAYKLLIFVFALVPWLAIQLM